MTDEAESREEVRSRRISTEDMIREQLVEINRIRMDLRNPDRVQAWSEALEALADTLDPWAEDDEQFLKEWEERPMRVKRLRHSSGDPEKDRVIVWPKATDCREAGRILGRLMDRAGIKVKRRTVSGPRRENVSQEARKQAQGGDEDPNGRRGAL